MEPFIITKLKRKVEVLKSQGVDELSILNAIKEELQFYILNYVYNHKEYSNLIMYGGTLLRIVYELPRMSEDLDFQTSKLPDIKKLEADLKKYFKDEHQLDIAIKTRSNSTEETTTLKIRFDIIDRLGLKVAFSDIRLRFDINIFPEANNFGLEPVPVVHDEISFTIRSYPLSVLMSSKINAVLNRKERDIGDKKTNCKPRDIFDLMWYMDRKIYPDLHYLRLKGNNYRSLLDLFSDIKMWVMNKVDDSLFKNDLAQFFIAQTEFEAWASNWRERFNRLIEAYSIYEVGEISKILYNIDFTNDTRHFVFIYESNKMEDIRFGIQISDMWFEQNSMRLGEQYLHPELEKLVQNDAIAEMNQHTKEYMGLFYEKIVDFIERNNRVFVQRTFLTKLIRCKAHNLDISSQIFLDKRLLKSVRLGDILAEELS